MFGFNEKKFPLLKTTIQIVIINGILKYGKPRFASEVENHSVIKKTKIDDINSNTKNDTLYSYILPMAMPTKTALNVYEPLRICSLLKLKTVAVNCPINIANKPLKPKRRSKNVTNMSSNANNLLVEKKICE